jgi:dipeptide/tripeptide permease
MQSSPVASDHPIPAFPRSFWVANAMEIFERMGWYGFYAVSTLYLTAPIADGGLGTEFQRSRRHSRAVDVLSVFFSGACSERSRIATAIV